MRKLKEVAKDLRLIADLLAHGVTHKQAMAINDELDHITYRIDFAFPCKGDK